jgi:Glycosyl hydrolase family 63 C-terminal domain
VRFTVWVFPSVANLAFSLEILKDWINLIDENGWVAREQILGEEARSKVRLLSNIREATNIVAGPGRIPNPGSQLRKPSNTRHGRDCFHRPIQSC